MPINLAFWGGLSPTGSKLLESIDLKPSEMLVEVVLVIGVPFVAGLTISAASPRGSPPGRTRSSARSPSSG